MSEGGVDGGLTAGSAPSPSAHPRTFSRNRSCSLAAGYEEYMDIVKREEFAPAYSLQEALEKFYVKVCPEKINCIPDIMRRYEGQVGKLVSQLERKYAPVKFPEFNLNLGNKSLADATQGPTRFFSAPSSSDSGVSCDRAAAFNSSGASSTLQSEIATFPVAPTSVPAHFPAHFQSFHGMNKAATCSTEHSTPKLDGASPVRSRAGTDDKTVGGSSSAAASLVEQEASENVSSIAAIFRSRASSILSSVSAFVISKSSAAENDETDNCGISEENHWGSDIDNSVENMTYSSIGDSATSLQLPPGTTLPFGPEVDDDAEENRRRQQDWVLQVKALKTAIQTGSPLHMQSFLRCPKPTSKPFWIVLSGGRIEIYHNPHDVIGESPPHASYSLAGAVCRAVADHPQGFEMNIPERQKNPQWLPFWCEDASQCKSWTLAFQYATNLADEDESDM